MILFRLQLISGGLESMLNVRVSVDACCNVKDATFDSLSFQPRFFFFLGGGATVFCFDSLT